MVLFFRCYGAFGVCIHPRRRIDDEASLSKVACVGWEFLVTKTQLQNRGG